MGLSDALLYVFISGSAEQSFLAGIITFSPLLL